MIVSGVRYVRPRALNDHRRPPLSTKLEVYFKEKGKMTERRAFMIFASWLIKAEVEVEHQSFEQPASSRWPSDKSFSRLRVNFSQYSRSDSMSTCCTIKSSHSARRKETLQERLEKIAKYLIHNYVRACFWKYSIFYICILLTIL